MGPNSDLVQVTVEVPRPPSAWREQFRYSTIPGEHQRRRPRWTDLLLPRRILAEAEGGNEWIKGAVICTWITGTILVINIIMTITALLIAYVQQPNRRTNRAQFEMAELYSGQCARSSHWATGLHVVINALSTILLGASNYVMQCLGAPSRADVDRAHAKARWLDIGTFSLRNFAVMDRRRKILWVLLLISSTPIHMIYNSVIFSSISTLEYGMFIIPNDLSPTESLISNDTTSRDTFLSEVGSDAAVVRAQIFNGTFINATTADCIAKYNVEHNTKYGTLIYVADREYFHNTSSLQVEGYQAAGYLGSSFGLYSVYEYMQGIQNETEAKQIQTGNLTLVDSYWSYRVWNYSLPDPAYDGHDYVRHFNLRDTTFSNIYAVANGSLSNDLLLLAEFNLAYNPSEGALREYLNTPSHWKNSSWAAGITFELNGTGILTQYTYIDETGARDVPVSHCLIKEEEQRCQLFFSPPIAIVVIICNITKVICMLLTARVKRTDLLLRVGDALASFLTRPDPTTLGRCLISRAEVTRRPQAWRLSAIRLGRPTGYTLQQRAPSPDSQPLDDLSPRFKPATPKIYPLVLPPRKRWYQAASWTRWTVVLTFFVACITTSIWLVSYAVVQSAGDFDSAMDLGFAQTSASTMIEYLSRNMIALVLLANTPQIVLSMLYFLVNGVLTCMHVAAEWDGYARHRRPLRVSWPRGQQQSSYYLSLPYQYSGPLLVLSATLHWLLSQSIFFVNIKVYNVYGEEDEQGSSRGCCYSPMAMFITLWVGLLGLGLLLAVGARQFKSHMPLATHCSAAISAACHPPPADEGAATKPLMWGEIPREGVEEVPEVTEYPYPHPHPHPGKEVGDGAGYAHCSFTSLAVVTPNLVRLYC
ncbi:uncharacterized protein BO97DRAFT_446566 [Aspergillus homomorphus CBS 101889]|uniref:DUF6536 domain-containing protein n=1 Tax=Aspergillus homomorphus (strain CBS 101889) TaxID=1450537 RepID=A0A395HIZ7_ASPHC|nr:hypothetical protein BO97DRAFT_446566 [Aspergillus homomorphus CBS 101889]RAL07797.1 hypothetical protein BO97DRAFT_446566 [Aspergillus homomorphus CBS 101889]